LHKVKNIFKKVRALEVFGGASARAHFCNPKLDASYWLRTNAAWI